ncbi:hypothetical protein MSKU15_1052 [Komagataeibacter diospyri]|nr:hypothetical protein MSKU15_1052 [Komagataeibacter diospyri]
MFFDWRKLHGHSPAMIASSGLITAHTGHLYSDRKTFIGTGGGRQVLNERRVVVYWPPLQRMAVRGRKVIVKHAMCVFASDFGVDTSLSC